MGAIITAIKSCFCGPKTHYVKAKVRSNVLTIIYLLNNVANMHVIAAHPDNSYNKKEIKTKDYYYRYSGTKYRFDGNYKNLNRVLTDFNPKRVKNIKFLMQQLECECDLHLYRDLWSRINSWVDYVIKLFMKAPKTFIGLILGCFCGGKSSNRQKTITPK